MRHRFLLFLALALTGVFLPGSTSSATAAVDAVAVTTVYVNRMGGVNLQGTVTCAGTAQAIKAGTHRYIGGELQPMDGVGDSIALAPTDTLLLLMNSDNYTVSQPVGRKSTIQVTHGSSRMNPCYTDTTMGPSGEQLQCAVGAVCPWRTDWFGWTQDQGLLWDYPTNGKFVANTLSVTGTAVGVGIMVLRDDRWYWANLEEDVFLPYQRSLKAISYR